MENIDKLFYINLDQRQDRMDHFIEQCKKHCIPNEKVERYSAVNGENYLFTQKELDMFKDFIENNIGKILNKIGKDYPLYEIFYKNVPRKIEHFFRKIEYFMKPTYNIHMHRKEIVAFAKSKEELKLKISTDKYNL